jgi:hypothetical protein
MYRQHVFLFVMKTKGTVFHHIEDFNTFIYSARILLMGQTQVQSLLVTVCDRALFPHIVCTIGALSFKFGFHFPTLSKKL